MLSVLNNKILLCYPMTDIAYDVRGDMKGLDARVEKRHYASHVEYCILGRWHGRKHKIDVKISMALYSLIGGDVEYKPIGSLPRPDKPVENVQPEPLRLAAANSTKLLAK